MSARNRWGGEMDSRGEPETRLFGRLRAMGVTAVLVRTAGSVGSMLNAGRSSDERLLVMLIALWVLAPFAAPM